MPGRERAVISPGTANTSRPSSSAKSAVISAPLRSRASTTTVAAQSPAMIRFRAGKRHGAGSTPGAYSETTRPRLADAPRELGVRGRVVAVDRRSRARRPSRRRPRARRGGLAVDPARQPADDDETGGRELASERARDRAAVRRAGPSADDRDRWRASSSRRPPHPRRKSPGGGSWIAREQRRETQASRRRIAAEPLAHAPARRSPGIAVGSASATCSGSPSAPASAAIVARHAATRARPRPESGSARPRSRAAPPPRSVRRGGARAQPLARRERRAPRRRRRLARRSARARPRAAAARDDEIEAVEQRPRELVAKRGEPLRRARAFDRRIAARAARAQVHRPDELEARREQRLPADARDRDEAVLERLPQRLEHRARELGQLVEEQDAAVREARPRRAAGRARRRRSPPSRRCGAARETAAPRRAPARRQERRRPSGSRHLERLRARRAAAGCPAAAARASSCRCPAGRRAAGCARPRPRSRARGARAPARARRRGPGAAALVDVASGERLERRGVDLAAEVRDRLGEVPDRHRLDPGERGLGRRLGGADEALEPGPARTLRDRERPRDRSHPPVERELADRRVLGEPLGRELLRRGSTASAIGRSKPDPSLRSAAGARLTVIRR